jgi:ATP-dependent Clp protease protease subunit
MPGTIAGKQYSDVFLGFNHAIDRRAVEQLIAMTTDAVIAGFSDVNICLGSIGGYIDQAYYAYEALISLPIRRTIYNISNVQSAANILFVAGDDRFACPGATFFFHQTSYDPPTGRITERYLEERIKAIRYDDQRSGQIIADRTGSKLDDVLEWQKTELVMDTAQAITSGMIQAVKAPVIPKGAFFHQIRL